MQRRRREQGEQKAERKDENKDEQREEQGKKKAEKKVKRRKRALVQKNLKRKTISQIADLEDTEENIAHLIEEFHLRVEMAAYQEIG